MGRRATRASDVGGGAAGASGALGIRLRLVSGLVLFVFALTHFLNHALGLVSLDTMERGRLVFLWVWRSPPGEALLLAALVLHVWLGLAGTLRLPSLRMPVWEAIQKASGLLIPVMLIPHIFATRVASDCGGRGRCSTCRVRVDAGLEGLPPPAPRELALLQRAHMPDNVRLACQVRPIHDVAVTPLLPPHVQPRAALTGEPYRHGRELEVAILFSDLRGFTTMTERRLAYDVVFVLNRYFQTMGETIRSHRGHLVQVFGDGMMALFSAREGLPVACRLALRAAAAMAERLEQLNGEIEEPLAMGIGLHAGSAIVGEMGYREATIVTAVGEPVNTASRLQEATKELDCQLVASAKVAMHAGADFSRFERREIEIRGLTRSLPVYAVPSARDLPNLGEERLTPMPPLSAVR